MRRPITILTLCVLGIGALSIARADDDGLRVYLNGKWQALDTAARVDTLISLRVTSGNNMGLTLYNTGFIGTNLADRSPSMEFPLRSTQEHLVRAGLWVGDSRPANRPRVWSRPRRSMDPSGASIPTR